MDLGTNSLKVGFKVPVTASGHWRKKVDGEMVFMFCTLFYMHVILHDGEES